MLRVGRSTIDPGGVNSGVSYSGKIFRIGGRERSRVKTRQRRASPQGSTDARAKIQDRWNILILEGFRWPKAITIFESTFIVGYVVGCSLNICFLCTTVV